MIAQRLDCMSVKGGKRERRLNFRISSDDFIGKDKKGKNIYMYTI